MTSRTEPPEISVGDSARAGDCRPTCSHLVYDREDDRPSRAFQYVRCDGRELTVGIVNRLLPRCVRTGDDVLAKTPFITVGNDELAEQPTIVPGDLVRSRGCKPECAHPVSEGTGQDGQPSQSLQFVQCANKTYLVGFSRRLLSGCSLCPPGKHKEPACAPS